MRISSDVTEQAEQCFRNIEKALQQGGCRLDEVVRVTYIIAERADFARLAPIFSRHFTKRRPAATAIVAGMIDPRMKLALEATARHATSRRIVPGGQFLRSRQKGSHGHGHGQSRKASGRKK